MAIRFGQMASADKSIKTGTLFRSATFNREGLNKEKRTITVRFSTETPVKRWFGTEILSHESGAVKLERLKAGGAVLCEHDPDKRCGITEGASITSERHGEAVVRFARTALGDQVMTEVEDGTLRWVSVGYVVNRFEVDENEDQYRAIDWEPLEVSFVGIPADPNARVLRSSHTDQDHESILMLKRTLLHNALPAAGGGGAPAVITKEDFTRELDEAREILGIQAHYQRNAEVVDLCKKAITDKMPIREFQRKVIDLVGKTPPAGEPVVITSPGQRATPRDNSIGARFIASESYKRAIKNGRIGSGNHIHVEFPDVVHLSRATTFGIGTSDISGSTDLGGTSGANIDIKTEWNRLNQQPITVAQLLGQGATTGDNVRFIRELTFTNDAARVAEAATKPQASLDFGVANATVEKTSVLLKVTEEMLADWAQAQSVINESLVYMVADKEDQYLLNGTGSSQITGLYNTSGIQTVSGANPIEAFKKADAYVMGANGTGFASNDAFIVHPLDWLAISLTKDANGQYLFGGPGYAPYGVAGFSNVSMIWGKPVVTTVRNTQGAAICGAFRNGATLWRRAGVTVRTTDSDGTDFQTGIVTVCADSRMTLTVKQPGRFCQITGLVLPS